MLTWEQIAAEWRNRCRDLECDLRMARAEAKRWKKREAAARGRITRMKRGAA